MVSYALLVFKAKSYALGTSKVSAVTQLCSPGKICLHQIDVQMQAKDLLSDARMQSE